MEPGDVQRKKQSYLGHRKRVKERFLKTGLNGFAPHEVFELLLFYVIPRKDTKQIGHDLIDRFGSIAGVIDADEEELLKIKGVTPRAVKLFKIIPRIVDVYYAGSREKTYYTTTAAVVRLLRSYYKEDDPLKSVVVCFDSELALIRITDICSGTDVTSPANMRRIIGEILKCGCRAAVLSHNSADNNIKPSREDIAAAEHIHRILGELGTELIDHIIIGKKRYHSMKNSRDTNFF